MYYYSTLYLLCFGWMFQLISIDHHPFVVVTPEKTGTHLLTKALGRIVDKEVRNCWAHVLSKPGILQELSEAEAENKFLHIHAYPVPEILQTLLKRGYKVIFLIRDPRDTIYSLYCYIEEGWFSGPLDNSKEYGQLSREDKIDELITGKRYKKNMVRALFVDRLLWMEQAPDFVYTARFENLVGSQGGASDRAQKKEILALAKHIACNLSEEHCQQVLQNLWGPQDGQRTTFRKGIIGEWKTQFSKEHMLAFQKKWGSLLKRLKYSSCDKEIFFKEVNLPAKTKKTPRT